jgi:RNA polymerase sigma-70 factor (ECF subfamily)
MPVMDAVELADVIARARRKDPAAFESLVVAYGARLYGYFYRLTGSRHDAEDLLQEVFVRIVRVIADYNHEGRFEAWLFRIATNLVRDRVRRSKREHPGGSEPGLRGERDEVEPIGEKADPAAGRPWASLEQTESLDRLQWAVSQLPEAEREVIMLRHFSQLSFREIADQMGTPLGTALARAHRGLAKLRDLMGE